MIYLDTHAVLLLYDKLLGKIPQKTVEAIEQADDLRISPIVLLELQYIREIQRIRYAPKIVVDFLARAINLSVCNLPFSDVVAAATELGWTRDPFDRLVVGHALAQGAELVTKDRLIRENHKQTIWD